MPHSAYGENRDWSHRAAAFERDNALDGYPLQFASADSGILDPIGAGDAETWRTGGGR